MTFHEGTQLAIAVFSGALKIELRGYEDDSVYWKTWETLKINIYQLVDLLYSKM